MNHLKIENIQPEITILELNRPDSRNALTIEMLNEIQHAVHQISGEQRARVLMIKGAGPVFCAGLDLKEAQSTGKAHELANSMADALKSLYFCPLVTIAVAHGAAIAGGAGLLSACDLVIAAEGTKIGYPETRRGLVAAMVLALLKRQIGDRATRELTLTGELIHAQKALSIGLITRVAFAEQLWPQALEMAQSVLKGAPNATRLTKTLISDLDPVRLDHDVDRALAFHMQARASDEATEGIKAFSEKREPSWK